MNKRERLLAIVTGVVLVIALGRAMVVGPLVERWSASVAEERELRSAIRTAEALAARLPRFLEERRALTQTLRHQEDASRGPVPRFIALIDTLAERAGFKPAAVRDRQGEPEGVFERRSFSLRVTTDLESLTRFLAELEATDVYIRVTSCTLAPAGGQAGADQLNADLVLVALVEPDADSIALGRKP